VPAIKWLELRLDRLFNLRCRARAFRTLSIAASAAFRSPTVVAPSKRAEILRNFSRRSCSVVIGI
jgi:hypothetical protein